MRQPRRDDHPQFLSPLLPTTLVARRNGLGGRKALIGSLLPVRLLWISLLRRRVPAQAVRNAIASLRDRRRPGTAVIQAGVGKRFRAAVLINVAPGEVDQLAETIESVRHYEGDEIKIVVVDDATGDYTRALISDRFPGVDFVQARVPAGSSFCVYHTQHLGFGHILGRYDVPMIMKIDPDSLMIDSGIFAQAAERFAADAELGQLGTTAVNAAGSDTDYRYSTWLAHTELRWSPRFRRLVASAKAAVNPLRFAQAGAYILRPEALRRAHAIGVLPYRQPWWSMQHDDVLIGLFVQAAGYRVGSFGAPGEPIASGFGWIPIEPEEAVAGGFKVVHSVRSSPSGRPEDEIRRYFAERRRTAVRAHTDVRSATT